LIGVAAFESRPEYSGFHTDSLCEGGELSAWPSLTTLPGKIGIENRAFAGDLKTHRSRSGERLLNPQHQAAITARARTPRV
jgi:hypothetical protein